MQNLHLRVCGLTEMISANNNTVMWHKVATNLLIVLTPIDPVVFVTVSEAIDRLLKPIKGKKLRGGN